ncbi:hypothetical protein NC652_011417 [Populus alba x Populus x berolinensis]|nr:hypothetical protein NC652_011417 [Populus alba x Populus x berolinensis]
MSNEDVNEFLDTQDFLSSNSFRSAESEFCKIPYDFDYDDVKRLPDIEDGMDSCIKSVGLLMEVFLLCYCKVSVLDCGSVVLKPNGVMKLCFVISILHHFQC